MSSEGSFERLHDIVNQKINPHALENVLFKDKGSVKFEIFFENTIESDRIFDDEVRSFPIYEVDAPVWVARSTGKIQSQHKGVKISAEVLAELKSYGTEILLAALVYFFLFKHTDGIRGEKFDASKKPFLYDYRNFISSLFERHNVSLRIPPTHTKLLPVEPIWEREISALINLNCQSHIADAVDEHLYMYVSSLIHGFFVYVPEK